MTINSEIYEQLQKDGIPDDIGVLFIFAVSVVDQKPQHFIRLMTDYPVVYTEMVLKGYFTIDESNDGLSNAVNKYSLYGQKDAKYGEFVKRIIKKLPDFNSKFGRGDLNINAFKNYLIQGDLEELEKKTIIHYSKFKEKPLMSPQFHNFLKNDVENVTIRKQSNTIK